MQVQAEMLELLTNKGLVRWHAGVEESPVVVRTMLGPLFDEVIRLRVLAQLFDSSARPGSARGLHELRPLQGTGWLPSTSELESAQVPAASAFLTNGSSSVRPLASSAADMRQKKLRRTREKEMDSWKLGLTKMLPSAS